LKKNHQEGTNGKTAKGHQAVFSVFPLKGTSAVVLATAAIGSVGGPCERVTPDASSLYEDVAN